MRAFSVRVKLPGGATLRFGAIGAHPCDVLCDAVERFGLGASVSVRAT